MKTDTCKRAHFQTTSSEALPVWVEVGVLSLVVLLYLFLWAQRPAKLLFLWDGAQYGLAVSDFNPAAHRPQPPGYPLFIWLCRVGSWLAGEVTGGIVATSAAGGAVTVAATWGLGRILLGSWQAALCGLLVALSPLMWTQGQLPLPYTWQAAGATLTVLAAVLAARRGTTPAAAFAGCVWGAAIGLRPELALFLAPAMIVLFLLGPGLWVREMSDSRDSGGRVKRLLTCLGVATGFGLAWVGYCAAASGSLGDYLAATRDTIWMTKQVRFQIASGLLENQQDSLRTGAKLAWGHAWLLVVPALALRGHQRRRLFAAVLPWLLTPGLFYLCYYCGRRGYLGLLAPPVALLMAAGVEALGQRVSPRWRAGVLLFFACFCVRHVTCCAALSRTMFLGETAAACRLALVREFDPAHTLVLAKQRYRTLSFHLPEYHVWWLAGLTSRQRVGLSGRILGSHQRHDTFDARWTVPAVPPRRTRLPAGITRLIAFDPHYSQFLKGRQMRQRVSGGLTYWELTVAPGSTLAVDLHKWRVEPPAAGTADASS